MSGNAAQNGHESHTPDVVMVPMDGEPSDIFLTIPVMVRMLANLLDRDDVLFTVLLGEAQTGMRLAKVRHRAQAADRPAPADQAS